MTRSPGGHVPVMLGEVMELIRPMPGQAILDCTAGMAGHSVSLLEAVAPGGMLLALDRDPEAVRASTERLANRV